MKNGYYSFGKIVFNRFYKALKHKNSIIMVEPHKPESLYYVRIFKKNKIRAMFLAFYDINKVQQIKRFACLFFLNKDIETTDKKDIVCIPSDKLYRCGVDFYDRDTKPIINHKIKILAEHIGAVAQGRKQ